MGKTKVMTNAKPSTSTGLKCEGSSIEVLPATAPERYLGRQLAIEECHPTELRNRLKCGWKAFFKFRTALCDRALPIKHRLKLFEAVVTPCALYANGTWTMTADSEKQLRSTQRRMLRLIFRAGRHPDEDWVEYIRRATHRSEQLAFGGGVSEWVSLQRARNFLACWQDC